jgi:hypothetical protein
MLFGEGDDFIDQKIPSLNFTVVKHRTIFIINRLAISSIADPLFSILIKVVKHEVSVFSMASARGDAS